MVIQPGKASSSQGQPGSDRVTRVELWLAMSINMSTMATYVYLARYSNDQTARSSHGQPTNQVKSAWSRHGSTGQSVLVSQVNSDPAMASMVQLWLAIPSNGPAIAMNSQVQPASKIL